MVTFVMTSTLAELLKDLRKLSGSLTDYDSSSFNIGSDNFLDLSVEYSGREEFYFFKSSKKGLIKRFVLESGENTEKICVVTLIRKGDKKFSPRFDFQILNKTKKAVELYNKNEVEEAFIKAKVDLGSCHKNFSQLIKFIQEFAEIELDGVSYAVIDKQLEEIYKNTTKDSAVSSFSKQYSNDITEKDISLLQNRRSRLDHFKKLLNDPVFFEQEKSRLLKKRSEDVWQNFFEDNSWIFGYGLQLVACEGVDEQKLEKRIVGNDVVDGSGKTIDAFLKTKGSISKILFCEIKNHHKGLLVEEYDRPGVFVPVKDLRGAVAQVQKTIHKMTLKITDNYHRHEDNKGNPIEDLLFVKPRGIVIIGQLEDFKTNGGINYEMLSSFELYRQQVSGIEIITYDELYERARFIIED